MDFGESDVERSWRAEVHAFVQRWKDRGLPEIAALRSRTDTATTYSELEQSYFDELGELGWNSLRWPAQHGGAEASSFLTAILSFELEHAGLPPIDLTVTSLAPVMMKFGTEPNLRDWLPGMRSSAIICALGYSEPEAGTDLASLRTSAVQDGDHWVINGEKTWNSGAHFSTHQWLAARTDPSAPKHRGISVFMVPIDAPGMEVFPMTSWAGNRINRVTFTDVRIHSSALIGQANEGWKLIAGALDFERAEIGARVTGKLKRMLDELETYCRETTVDGMRLIDRESVRQVLAELTVEVEIAELMSYEITSAVDAGEIPTVSGTMQKVFASELRTRLSLVAIEIAGASGQLTWADPAAPADGMFEHQYRTAPVQRFGGGTNEVMRDVIAQRGLGLPRGDRA